MARRRSEPDGSRALLPDERLWELEDRYRGSFGPPSISYGTVRDLADSAVTIPGLVRANHDMKDLQRCWMLKAVLGSVTSGGRILEIGAGEPLVAGILSRMGFAVTVVDPYDGSGNGPREFEQFSLAYPGLEIVRDSFPPASDLGAGFSAVYSVSVLEHIDATELGALMEGIAEHLDPLSGRSIHAIDHVVAGFSADSHRERLEVIAGACGIRPAGPGRDGLRPRARPRHLLGLGRGPRALARGVAIRAVPDAADRVDPARYRASAIRGASRLNTKTPATQTAM